MERKGLERRGWTAGGAIEGVERIGRKGRGGKEGVEMRG